MLANVVSSIVVLSWVIDVTVRDTSVYRPIANMGKVAAVSLHKESWQCRTYGLHLQGRLIPHN